MLLRLSRRIAPALVGLPRFARALPSSRSIWCRLPVASSSISPANYLSANPPWNSRGFAKDKKGGKGGRGGKEDAAASIRPDEFDLKTPKLRMQDHINYLKQEFSNLRGNRVTPNQLDNVMVVAYEKKVALKSLAQIAGRGPSTLVVTVHDSSLLQAASTGIRDCGMSLSPQIQGNSIMVNFPAASQEMRDEVLKLAGKKAEETRIKIRHVRKDVLDELKRYKDTMAKDDQFRLEKEVQKLTDEAVKFVNEALSAKEKDINS